MCDPSEDLLQLVFLALDHAVQSVITSNGPLVPFAILDGPDGKRTLSRFATGRNPDEARHHARDHVARDAGCTKYAVASDGTLTEDGKRVPVVMVEAGRRGDPNAFCFVQRFASSATTRFSHLLGNPGIVDLPEILRIRGDTRL